jgi:hypothetical protein
LLIFLWGVARLGRRKKSGLTKTLMGEIGEAQRSVAPGGFVTVHADPILRAARLPSPPAIVFVSSQQKKS